MSTDEQQKPVGDTPTGELETKKEVSTRRDMPQHLAEVSPGFGTAAGFELTMRIAKAMSQSTLVPEIYRDFKAIKEYGKVKAWEPNPNAISNCIIAVNMAQRMRADPLLVMQNLYVIEGRPSWASVFIGAMLNNSGRFSELEFQLSEWGEPREVKYSEAVWNGGQKSTVEKKVTVRDRTCVAVAASVKTGRTLRSPEISIDMAIAEGWLTKKGSKWQTMPELMLIYRAQSFFGKLYAPDLLMGIPDENEIIDISPTDWKEVKPDDLNKDPKRGSSGLAATIGRSQPPTPENEDGEGPRDAAQTQPTKESVAAADNQQGQPEKKEKEPAQQKADPQPQQAKAATTTSGSSARRRPGVTSVE